ncbi:hypothetical protein ACFL4C_04250, partial [Candidatus Omnitrophota bacterium]
LDDTIADLEPWIKEQIGTAADPIMDYLLGRSQSLNVVISLEPVKESLKDHVWEAFTQSPPPELAGIPQDQLKQYFDKFYLDFFEQIPSTFELDEILLGDEIPANITRALTEAERGLGEARQYVGYFQLGYNLLIGFILLLILGIIFINREVRGTTRELVIIFLIYGALEYAGIFIAKYFAGVQLEQLASIPSQLQAWLPQLLTDFLSPLEMLSLGLLIGGIALIIVSFVYKPREISD